MSQAEAEAQPGVEMGIAGSQVVNAQTTKGFLSLRKAAIRVLFTSPSDGMTPKEIYDSAIKQGLVDSKREGKTPWATLGALFYTDMKTHKSGSSFRLINRGRFALTDEALSGKTVSGSASAGAETDTQKRTIDKKPATDKKYPSPTTTDIRGRPLFSPNTHPHGKTICGVKQKTKNGTVICRIPWTGKKHDGDHRFEAFRAGGGGGGSKKSTASKRA